MPRTKIVCTIGPASRSPETLEQLIRAGMDVARLNFSHGAHAEHLEVITGVRRIAELLGICTRTDILRVSASRRETERPQPGWRPSLSRSTFDPSCRADAGGDTNAETQEPNGPDRDVGSRGRARARRER